jgi:hypothetical protein
LGTGCSLIFTEQTLGWSKTTKKHIDGNGLKSYLPEEAIA